MVCSVGTGTVAEYYLSEQENYYTDGQEPAGKWYAPEGTLGLIDGDEIDPQVFRRLHSMLGLDGKPLGVRHQMIWNNLLPDLKEDLAHLC